MRQTATMEVEFPYVHEKDDEVRIHIFLVTDIGYEGHVQAAPKYPVAAILEGLSKAGDAKYNEIQFRNIFANRLT